LVCSTNLPFSSQMPFPNPNSWFHLVWGEDEGATNSIIPRASSIPLSLNHLMDFLKLLSKWSCMFLQEKSWFHSNPSLSLGDKEEDT
jgi:hypothetical protein